MMPRRRLKTWGTGTALAFAGVNLLRAADSSTNLVAAPAAEEPTNVQQNWNWHVQSTAIVQGYPGFPADYSGPNSLSSGAQARETISLDLMVGVRLWRGAEAHVDGLMWQGYGVSGTVGVESFPSGEAFRLGTSTPNVNIPRLFLRQTIGFGGDQEDVADDELHLAGREDVSRLTLTVGKMSAKDIFDNNAYANDPRTQFMSWGLMANEAWDYPADSLGFITGFVAELNQPRWTLRYGFFQVPRVSNGTALDKNFLEAWAMVTEYEFRYAPAAHPGTARLLGYLNQADMGSYEEALSLPNTDITLTRAYRQKYGFGLNVDQEVVTNVGVFSRLGWSDGQNEAWMFSDVDRAASAGISVQGAAWQRPDDTVALAGVLSGISSVHQQFLAAGGTGILAGDGRLNYAWEKTLETYYNFQVRKEVQVTLDYQFIADPAFNRDRGPVSVFAARLHVEF
jgi:high affinity Mn2+ porin